MPNVALPVPTEETPALAELAKRRQWVCWRLEKRDGKPTKVPVQPNGILAATDNARTWSSYEDVREAARRHGWGVGYVFDGDVVGVDLDKCRDPSTGRLEDWAQAVVDRLRSYTEVSPSGTGVHVLCLGGIPRDGGRRGQVEVYTRGRFFCVTGRHVEGTVDEIAEAEEALEWLWATHVGRSTPEVEPAGVEPGDFPWDKFDALMENDPKFRRTWLHRRPDLEDQSLSAYDFSLCVLAGQAGWNDAELAALIVQHRRKWGGTGKSTRRPDYLARSVGNAREVLRRRAEGNESLGAATARVVARERAAETLAGGQEAALRELRVRLGLPIARVVITGERTAVAYSFVLEDGRRIALGGPGQVLDQGTMRRAAFAAVGKVIPQVKQPMWDATVMVLQAASEREAAADSDPVRELTEAVDGYAYRQTVLGWDDEEAGQAFMDGDPLRRDGRLMLTVKSLHRWCRGENVLVDLKQEQLRDRLRLSGWTGADVVRRVKGKVVCRTYWGAPDMGEMAEEEPRITTPLRKKDKPDNELGEV